MKRMVALLTTMTVLALPLVALAGRGFGRGPGRGIKDPAVRKQVLRDAGLNDQQIRRIEILHNEAEKKLLDIRHERDSVRLEMKQLMQQHAPDEAAVFAQLEKLHAVALQIKKARLQLRLDCRKEMSAEQWEKVRSMRAERRMQRFKRGRGFGKGKGMGPGRGMGGPAQ